MTTSPSVPQRLSRLEHVADALAGLLLAAEAGELLALPVEEVLLAHQARAGERAAGEDGRDRGSQALVVFGDLPGAPHQVELQLHARQRRLPEDGDIGARPVGLVAAARQRQGERLRVAEVAAGVDGD